MDDSNFINVAVIKPSETNIKHFGIHVKKDTNIKQAIYNFLLKEKCINLTDSIVIGKSKFKLENEENSYYYNVRLLMGNKSGETVLLPPMEHPSAFKEKYVTVDGEKSISISPEESVTRFNPIKSRRQAEKEKREVEEELPIDPYLVLKHEPLYRTGKPLSKGLHESTEQELKKEGIFLPGLHEVKSTRTSTHVSQTEIFDLKERIVLIGRKTSAAKSLTAFLRSVLKDPNIEIKPNQLITTGCSHSGGGLKSLTYNIGIFKNWGRKGLYQSFLYSCGVSGGSWFMSCLEDYNIDLGITMSKTEMKRLINTFRQQILKIKVNFDITGLINMQFIPKYAEFLSQLFVNKVNQLGHYKDAPVRNHTPFPILTAAAKYHFDDKISHETVEMTPISTNFIETGLSVDSDITGRSFCFAETHTTKLGYTLPETIAITGSAFAISTSELSQILSLFSSQECLDFIANKLDLKIFAPPKIPNVFKGILESQKGIYDRLLSRQILEEEKIDLLDHGVRCTLTIAPLLRRKCRIIFINVLDKFDGKFVDFREFLRQEVEQYEKEYPYQFPMHFFDKKHSEFNYDKRENFIFYKKEPDPEKKKGAMVVMHNMMMPGHEETRNLNIFEMFYSYEDFKYNKDLGFEHSDKTLPVIAEALLDMYVNDP